MQSSGIDARHILGDAPNHVYLCEDNPRFKVLFQSTGSMMDQRVPEDVRNPAALEITSRPWFTLTWIYQALVLSKMVWVQYGQHRIC